MGFDLLGAIMEILGIGSAESAAGKAVAEVVNKAAAEGAKGGITASTFEAAKLAAEAANKEALIGVGEKAVSTAVSNAGPAPQGTGGGGVGAKPEPKPRGAVQLAPRVKQPKSILESPPGQGPQRGSPGSGVLPGEGAPVGRSFLEAMMQGAPGGGAAGGQPLAEPPPGVGGPGGPRGFAAQQSAARNRATSAELFPQEPAPEPRAPLPRLDGSAAARGVVPDYPARPDTNFLRTGQLTQQPGIIPGGPGAQAGAPGAVDPRAFAPQLDTSRMGLLSGAAGQSTLDARAQVYDRGSPYLKPSYENPIIRGIKKIGQQLPLVGALFPNTEGASFPQLDVEALLNDPEKAKLWEGLSQQERAFAMFDGTNEGANLLSQPTEVWQRLMGGTSTSTRGGLETTTRVGGALGQIGRGDESPLAGVGLGGGGGGGSVSGAGGSVAPQAQISLSDPLIPDEEEEPRGGGRRRGGALPTGIATSGGPAPGPFETDSYYSRDDGPRKTFIATQKYGIYNFGDQIQASDLLGGELVNNKLAVPEITGDQLVGSYRALNAQTGETEGGIERLTQAQARLDPAKRNYIEEGGEVLKTLDDAGNVVYTPQSSALTSRTPQRAESARGAKPYRNNNDGGAIGYPTDRQLQEAPAGTWSPITAEGVEAGQKLITIRQQGANGRLTGPAIETTEALFRGMPEEERANYRTVSGKVVEVIDENGDVVVIPIEEVTGGAPSAYQVEHAFKARAYEDTLQGNAVVYPSDSQLRNAEKGRYIPRAETVYQLTDKEVDAQISFMAKKPQTQRVLQGLGDLESGRSMGAFGRFGVWSNAVALTFGDEETGQALFELFSGEGKMSPAQLGGLHRTIASWANQKKEAILNDQRISGIDQDRIDYLVSLGETFVNKDQVRQILVEFTMYDMLNSELGLQARGFPQQFPVSSDTAAVDTMIEFEDWGLTEAEAAFWVNKFRDDYPVLAQPYGGGQPSLDPQ